MMLFFYTIGGVPHHLVSCARITAPHIAADRRSEAWPDMVLCDWSLNPGDPIVSRQRAVVILLQNFENEGSRSGRDAELALAVQHTSSHSILTL